MNKIIIPLVLALVCLSSVNCADKILSLDGFTIEETTPTRSCNNKMINKLKETKGFDDMFSNAVIQNQESPVCI